MNKIQKQELIRLQVMISIALGVISSMTFYLGSAFNTSNCNQIITMFLCFFVSFCSVFYKIQQVKILITIALFITLIVSVFYMIN